MRNFILITVLLLTACAQTSQQEAVGAMLPLTGEFSTIGVDIQRGMELANAEAANPMKIIYEDVAAMDPAKAVSPANKLITVDKVSAGVVLAYQEAVALGPVFAEHNVPLVVQWDSSADIVAAGNTVFSTGFSSEKSAQAMADYAYNELKLRSVAIVWQPDPYSTVVAAEFAKKFKELGGKVVYNEQTAIDESDFRTILTKIKGLDADSIYFPVVPTAEVDFVNQYYNLGMSETLLAADWFFADTIHALGERANGVYLHTIYADNSEQLLAAHKTKYGSDPIDINVVNIGYVNMQKILAARDTGKPMNEALLEVIGPTHSLDRVEKVYKVVDGKLVLMN